MGGKFKKIQNLQKKNRWPLHTGTHGHTGTRLRRRSVRMETTMEQIEQVKVRGCWAETRACARGCAFADTERSCLACVRPRVGQENIVPLKYGRPAAQLAATAQAATRPPSNSAFPPQHDAERAVRWPCAHLFFSFFFFFGGHCMTAHWASTLHRRTRRGCWPPRAMTTLWRFGSSTWHGSIAYVSLVRVPTGATDRALYRCRCAAGLTAPWPTWFCASSATLSTTSATKSPPSCCASTLSASVRPHVRLPTNAD
jgi:hypothetical protein